MAETNEVRLSDRPQTDRAVHNILLDVALGTSHTTTRTDAEWEALFMEKVKQIREIVEARDAVKIANIVAENVGDNDNSDAEITIGHAIQKLSATNAPIWAEPKEADNGKD